MSMDKSLKSRSSLTRHRNVLTRAERIERLKELGRWTEDMKVMSLPKVAHRKAAVGKKGKTKEQKQEAESAAAESQEKEKEKETK